MTKAEVTALFLEGIELFKKECPIPESKDRIRCLGWRTAQQAQKVIDQGLENTLEAYVELKREIS